jgi:hypothetical protein
MTEQRPVNEIWLNPTATTVFIKKLDHRGELTKDEQVDAGKKFALTREERELNMEKAASEDLCPFRNGTFQPVRLLGDDELSRELASNPNAMSREDMVSLVKTRAVKDFVEKLHAVRNINTLERLLAVAYDEDASVRKVETIKARITEIRQASEINMRPAAPVGPQRESAVFGRAVSPR